MFGVRGFSAAVAAIAVCAMAGCGDDDSGPTEAAKQAPWATGPSPERFAKQIAGWMAETKVRRDCAELDALRVQNVYSFKCPLPRKVRASMARFKVLDSAIYGSAAVLAYRTGDLPDGAIMLMYVHPSRLWAVNRMGLLYEPAPRSSDDDSRDGYDAAVAGYLRGVRERDCELLFAYSAAARSDGKRTCKSELKSTKELAKALEASPSSEPSYLGGNSDFGFYSLQTPKPKPSYVTISVVKAAEGAEQPHVVLDAAPGPAASSG
jgi:hypothetical protein